MLSTQTHRKTNGGKHSLSFVLVHARFNQREVRDHTNTLQCGLELSNNRFLRGGHYCFEKRKAFHIK